MAIGSSGQDVLARVVAIYGAAVATASLVWTVRRDYRDRPNLRVRAAVPVSDVDACFFHGAGMSGRRYGDGDWPVGC